MAEQFDLIVIGAGPEGYVAARRAAQLGLRTALVQKRKDMATTKDAKDVELLMGRAEVTVVRGAGRLDGPGRVLVDTDEGSRKLTAGKIILATGSRPAGLPGVTSDGNRILTSDHLLEIEEIPDSLIVLGAGAVGVELACVMQGFGCKVTLVEMLDRVLPLEDSDCSDEVAKALKRQGMKVKTGCRARDIVASDTGVEMTLENRETGASEQVRADRLLVAVGRRPFTGDLGLDTVGVKTDKRGFIQTDAFMETTTPGVYAIGDIVPTPQLAHVASHEALIAAGHAAGHEVRPLRYGQVPSCTYSSPEVASVGATEGAAREAGYRIRTGKFPFSALGKASILDEPHGFVKEVSEQDTGKILGVHMVGPRVTEMIGGAATAMGCDMDFDAWSEVIQPHPTLNEAVTEAVLAAAGRPLHGG